MSDINSDNEGTEVVPRPMGKRIRPQDLHSGSDSNDESDAESFHSEDEEEDYNDHVDSEEEEDDDDAGASPVKEEESERRRKKDKKKKEKEKKEKKSRKKEQPAAKRRRAFFIDEAEVGGDDEEDEEDEYADLEEAPLDDELNDIREEANARTLARHAANREFQAASAQDLAADYENKYRRQQTGAVMPGFGGAGQGSTEVARRSLVPGVNDPAIFMVRAKTGMEQPLVKAILLKSIDRQRKGQTMQIKSVFCSNTPGYIYIEAMNEPFAREAITGLHGVYYTTLKQVPIAEMSMLLTLTVKKKPIKKGQWCRMRRGPNKGDLARVLKLLEGGTRALVQLVPRPDYDPAARKGGGAGAARPMQKLFLAENAKQRGHEVDRKRNPVTGEFNDFWNNDYYNHGFLFKEVKVDTYLTHATNPLPRLDEVTMFQDRKRESAAAGSDDEDEAGGSWNSKQGIMREMAKLEEELGETADRNVTFRAGDTVQVMEGEQRNLRGVVVSINERTGLAVVQPLSEYQLGHLTIETRLLVKYIRPGAHVKVLNGKHLGQTGRVVSVYRSDGDNIAAILTDGVNTEITVNMGHLQVTNEVTTGLNSLAGYELYDLLILNANDYGVVVFVGTEHLKVLTLNDVVKEVLPMEVKGKKPPSRGATGAFDHLKNPLSIGDTVSVVEGTHIKKTGTIKHINRSVLWLHSTSHLKNSGIFVVKGKSCLLAGSKIKGNINTAATLLNAAFSNDSQPGATLIRTQAFRKGGGKGGGQDENHGKAVKLTQGGFKGHLGRIVDSTNTHYSVELHGRMKVVNVPKTKIKFVDGDNPVMGNAYVMDGGEGGGRGVDGGLIPNTPFLANQTPSHMIGNETPAMLGSMTPNRPETPGRDSGGVWNAATVLEPSQSRWGQDSADVANDSWYDDNARQHDDAQWQASSSVHGGGGSSNVDDWGVDMIVLIRHGPDTGKYGIIVDPPNHNGYVNVRMRESSSSYRNSDDNEIITKDVRDLRLGEPRKKDTVIVLNGKHKGHVDTLKRLLGNDAALTNMPMELFTLDQLAWLYTR